MSFNVFEGLVSVYIAFLMFSVEFSWFPECNKEEKKKKKRAINAKPR